MLMDGYLRGSFAVEHKFGGSIGSYDDAIKLIGEMTEV